MGTRGSGWAVGLAVWLHATMACAQVVINEVLPDPAGRDAGQEFVELHNPSAQEVSLAGLVLESWHGARRGWVRAWAGASGDRCGARGFFLLGGDELPARADAALDSDLTNNSGAVRLRTPGGVTSVVGWGPLSDADLFEGTPAAAPSAGHSLARVPDGANTGRTAHDLREAPLPTPRASNGRLGPVFASVPIVLAPALPWPGQASVLRVRLAVVGDEAALTAGFVLRVVVRSSGGVDSVLPVPVLPAILAAHETTDVAIPWRPEVSGVWNVRAQLGGPAGDSVWGDLQCRVGQGELGIVELMATPRPGEPDWIECTNRSASPVRLDAFSLVTPRAGVVQLPFRILGPGARVVLCATAADVARAFPGLDSTACVELGPGFPSLPARSSTSEAPVSCALAGRDGVLADWAPYGVLHASTGRAWERFDDTVPADDPRGWQLSADPRGGTPGVANTAQPSGDAPAPSVRVEAASLPGAAVAIVDLGATPCDGALTVCTLSGRRVVEVTRFAQARGRIRVPLAWRESRVEPGVYALVLDVRRAMNRGVERRAVSVVVTP